MPRLIYIIILPGIILLSVLCSGCAGEERPAHIQGVPLAHVNGEPLMSETFREEYVGYLLKTGLQDKPQYRQHVLNSQIASMLLVQEAETQHIESEPAFNDAKERIKRKLLVDIYVRKALFDTIQVSEDELKDMFVRANTTVTARHLYAPTLQEARALRERLLNGETFEALAKEVFTDTSLANNGGLVGAFTLDDMDLAFEKAAYNLKIGELSEPVRTAQGYSIIKVEDRFIKPLITEYEYAERRDRTNQFVSYRKKMAARAAHLNALLEDLAPEYNPPVFDRLYALVTGELSFESGEAAGSWLDEPLVTFSGTAGASTWTVRDFQRIAAETSDRQRAAVRSMEDLETFINGLIGREEMVARALSKGFDRDPEFEYEYEKALDAWIWSTATQQLVEKATLPEDSLGSYYEAHKEDFLPAATIELSEILLDSREKARALEAEVTPETFSALATRHSIRPGAESTGGYMGFVRQQQLGVLWSHVYQARSGDIVGPVEVDGHYVFLKVGDRREAEGPTAGVDKAEILRHFVSRNSKRLIQEHVEKLTRESEVTIDYALLSSLPLKQDVQEAPGLKQIKN